MSFPDLEADPAELMLASTPHMDAPSIFFDESLAHWALLSHQIAHPMVLVLTQYLVPNLHIVTAQWIVSSLSANTAYYIPAIATQMDRASKVSVDGLIASFLLAEFHSPAQLRVFQAQKSFKVASERGLLFPDCLHQKHVGSIDAVLPRAHWKELILTSVAVAVLNVASPTIQAKGMLAGIGNKLVLRTTDQAFSE